MAHAKPIEEQPLNHLVDGVDPELIALGAPPKNRRFATITVMALAVAASVAMLTTLRADIGYFFESDRAVALGEATAVGAAAFQANSYATIGGTPMASASVTYSRIIGSAEYAVFPLAGQRRVFVHVPVESQRDAAASARREFTGRMVTFGQMGGRLDAVRHYMSQQLGMPISAESYVLLADEPPGAYWWALALAVLCIFFVLLNLMMLVRWFKPLRLD